MSVPVFTRAQVEHLAELAALALGDDEAEAIAQELARIVAYVQELSAVDTSEVAGVAEPSGGAASASMSAWRPDVVVPGLTTEEALGAAARATDGGFAVPGFVSSGSTGAGSRDGGGR